MRPKSKNTLLFLPLLLGGDIDRWSQCHLRAEELRHQDVDQGQAWSVLAGADI
jgi:hypothetical protein